MTLDHTPTAIVTETFAEWLDYTLLGAEELGRLTEEDCDLTQVLYDRPLTPRQQPFVPPASWRRPAMPPE